KMKIAELEKEANRIADAIVDFVERKNGPVTLSDIHREIPGFGTKELPQWEYYIEREDGEIFIWDQMTEAGCAALRKVMSERRVCVQCVSSRLYLLDVICLDRETWLPKGENWLPIVLLPVRAANLDTPRWLIRCSQRYRDYCIEQPGHRP